MDINADLGEWYGRPQLEMEQQIMPYLTSCNIACGFHSGDPLTIQKTIAIAMKHGVKIGAHPSFPDLQGFGRRMMHLSEAELTAVVSYQVSAIKGMVGAMGGQLHHVKAHGALYNAAMKDATLANALVKTVKNIDENLVIYGLPHSAVKEATVPHEMVFWSEGFVDRAYEADLSLRSRALKGAVLHDLEGIEEQLQYFKKGQVKTYDGQVKNMVLHTICIHSDTPKALEIAQKVSATFQSK